MSLVQHTGRERVENNYQSDANLNNFPISSFYGSPGSTSSHEYLGMPGMNPSSREYIGMPINKKNFPRKTKKTTRKKNKRGRKPNGRK